MGRLKDRVAVVTGAGRGIGAAVARQMAAEGACVVVADLGVDLDGAGGSSGPANEVVEEIVKAGGIAVASHADVSDHQAAEGLIRGAIDEFGKLDVLVNAAGILRDRMIFNMTEEEWDSVINVHLKGCFNTTKHASVYWRAEQRAHSRLINFTSIAGLYGAPSQANYAAAKLGIVGLTFSCARALEKYGVTSNCVSPGAATRMSDTIPREKLLAAGVDVERDRELHSAENVAPAVLYLASEESDWLNGRIIGAQENRVSLWSNPAIQRQIISPGGWDLDYLFEEMPRSFQPTVEGRIRLEEAG
jgi:NAD(P)-dependent dehydrogenase (short-subunit alcohol dehydrogenase family)